MRRTDASRPPATRSIAYQFADVAGLLNFIHGLSQWIYTRPDADERDLLVAILHATAPKATPGTLIPLYLTLPIESGGWPIKPSSVDGAQLAEVIPADLRPLSWTNLALLLALQPFPAMPRRDDLVFIVQGTRSDLLGVLDAIFALEHEHAEDVSVLLAPVEPTSLGGLKAKSSTQRTGDGYKNPDWSLEPNGAFDPVVACLVKVSGLRRFYLLEKTITDPHLRLFYRHIFPPHVPVPPGLQVYVEWGYRYPLPPASFIMEAWQRDKLGLVLLPAPGTGEPLIVSSAITFRPVLHVARGIQIADWAGASTLTPVTAQAEPKLLDVQLRLHKRAPDDTHENEQALRHRIQNDLWRLQRLLAREREAKSRRLYVYADNDPRDMARLRDFIMGNPLAILNEFRYFCGRFRDHVYHLVLLPTEDGTGVVTPDRFPDMPESARVFRREPAWAAAEAGHELFIPRDLELYPALAPGLEDQDEILRQALGMTDTYNYEAGKVMVLLWPDRAGNLINYHIPLDTADGFRPLGAAAKSINTQALTPETVQAVSAQIMDSLNEALQPERIPAGVLALRDQVATVYQTAWDAARVELDQLLARGAQAEQIARTVRERFADVQAIESQQLDDWQRFLSDVLALAEKIDKQAAGRDAELDKRQADLIGRLRKQVEKNAVRQLNDKFEVVAKAMQSVDLSEDRATIAARLEALAAEIRGVGQ